MNGTHLRSESRQGPAAFLGGNSRRGDFILDAHTWQVEGHVSRGGRWGSDGDCLGLMSESCVDPIGLAPDTNLCRYCDNAPTDATDPGGLKIVIRGIGTERTFSEIQKNDEFFEKVLSAFQAVVGDCARLKFVNTERLSYGTPRRNMYHYAEIGFTEKSPRGKKCKCDACWQDLKKAIESTDTFPIEMTRSTKTSQNGWNSKDNVAVVNPDWQPLLWELVPVGPKAKPTGAILVAWPTEFAPFLWHEVIGHGFHGLPQHDPSVQNFIDPRSTYYDPVIQIENMARLCLGLRERVHQYYTSAAYQNPQKCDVRPYTAPIPPPRDYPNGPEIGAR